MHKNFWNAKQDPPKWLRLAPEMPFKHTERPTQHSNATQTLKKISFFWPVPPWGRPQTPQKRLPKASKTYSKRCTLAYPCDTSYLSNLNPPKKTFGSQIGRPLEQLSHACAHFSCSSILKDVLSILLVFPDSYQHN